MMKGAVPLRLAAAVVSICSRVLVAVMLLIADLSKGKNISK